MTKVNGFNFGWVTGDYASEAQCTLEPINLAGAWDYSGDKKKPLLCHWGLLYRGWDSPVQGMRVKGWWVGSHESRTRELDLMRCDTIILYRMSDLTSAYDTDINCSLPASRWSSRYPLRLNNGRTRSTPDSLMYHLHLILSLVILRQTLLGRTTSIRWKRVEMVGIVRWTTPSSFLPHRIGISSLSFLLISPIPCYIPIIEPY